MTKTFRMQLVIATRKHFMHLQPSHEFSLQPLVTAGYSEDMQVSLFNMYPTDQEEIAYFQEHLGDTFEVTLTPKVFEEEEEEEE